MINDSKYDKREPFNEEKDLTEEEEKEDEKIEIIKNKVGNDVGLITNRCTAMFDVLAKFEKDSIEYKEMMYRISCMQGYQQEMLNGISGIMDLAAASGENLGLVSDIVTDAITAFGLSASDSAHFADVLASASSNANTNVAMLGESFKYVAPVAGALGYSVEDTAVALGILGNDGNGMIHNAVACVCKVDCKSVHNHLC